MPPLRWRRRVSPRCSLTAWRVKRSRGCSGPSCSRSERWAVRRPRRSSAQRCREALWSGSPARRQTSASSRWRGLPGRMRSRRSPGSPGSSKAMTYRSPWRPSRHFGSCCSGSPKAQRAMTLARVQTGRRVGAPGSPRSRAAIGSPSGRLAWQRGAPSRLGRRMDMRRASPRWLATEISPSGALRRRIWVG